MKNKFIKIIVISLISVLPIIGIAVTLSSNLNTLFTTYHHDKKNINHNNSDTIIDDSAATYKMANDIFTNFKNLDDPNNPLKSITDVNKFLTNIVPNSDNKTGLKIINDIFETNYKNILHAQTIYPITADVLTTNKLPIKYNDGTSDKLINSHENSDVLSSTDIYAIKGMSFAMMIIINLYIQDALNQNQLLSNNLKYETQITNNLLFSIVLNNAMTSSYVKIFTNMSNNDYIFNTFLNSFLYKIFSQHDKSALIINAKIFNNLFPIILLNTLVNPNKIQPFIDDGTLTLLPTQLFHYDELINLNNYASNIENDSYIFINGQSIENKYYLMENLIDRIPDNNSKNDPSWIFNSLFIALSGHNSAIMYACLYDIINKNLSMPIATNTSDNAPFQFFNIALAPPQNHRFLHKIKYDLNLMVFKYSLDIDCYRYFVTNDKLKDNVINSIINYNNSEYNDFTPEKIAIITVTSILGALILLFIIYKLTFYYLFKKEYFKYKKNHK